MKETIKEIDLRKMPIFERHERIFRMLNSLSNGETLRIINDHDPKPLHYQLDAEYEGQFKWSYEKEGPKDWIVKIKKSNGLNKKEKIKTLLKALNSNNLEEIKEKGKEILKNIQAEDLAVIEQELIREGVTRKEMRKLCNIHLEIMKEGLEKTEVKLLPGHPIHTLMEEHKFIINFVNELQNTVKLLEDFKDLSNARHELNRLNHLTEHLIESESHQQREERILFPALKKQGVVEPSEIMREEHEDINASVEALQDILVREKEISYSVFLKCVKDKTEYLAKEFPEHIFKENNILFQMALQVIPKKEWATIKEEFDKIGYCCFTPNVKTS